MGLPKSIYYNFCKNRLLKNSKTKLIMIIELSGLQFGLKSYSRFFKSREFDVKSQVCFQTKIARHKVQLLLYYSHFEITDLLKVESETLSNLILYGKQMIRFRAKVMRFRTEMMR